MYGQVDPTDHRAPATPGAPTGRHRGRRLLPAPVALGLTVLGLLSAFGAGAALVPTSVTGVAAEPAPAAETASDTVAAEPAGAGTDLADAPDEAQRDEPAAEDPAAEPAAATPAKPAAKPKPRPKPAAKPRPVARTDRAKENEVTRLVNVERREAGCGAVTTNENLRTAMRGHVRDMAAQHYFSHDSKDGRSPWDRAKAAGYPTPIGENIAKGQRTPADVMESWMNSPGHRSNILNCSAKAIGVGLAFEGNTPIWGQLFGSR